MSIILRCRDYRGETALHKAVRGRFTEEGDSLELVQRLLSLGADPTQRDMHGRTALFLARIWHHDEMILTLKAAIQRKLESPPTPEEAFSEVETVEHLADTTQASSSDDDVSCFKSIAPPGEMPGGLGLAHKAEKVQGRKRSWWRSLLSPEAHL